MKPFNDLDFELMQPLRRETRTSTMKMRREELRMDDQEAGYLFDDAEYAILSTCGEDGWPYGVPISFAVVGQNIYFHSAKEGRKLDNIAFNKKASMTIVGKTKVLPEHFSTRYQSVIVFGEIVQITDDDEKIDALMAIVHKYSPGHEVAGEAYAKSALEKVSVYAMTIEHLTGKEKK